MSDDQFREFSQQSWFGRIANSIKGILFGVIFLIISFPLLFLNEGCSVRTARSLSEGGKTVISIPSDKVDPANDGKLVHLTGIAVTTSTITDPVFGVSAQALRLGRTVEMYQWSETSHSNTAKDLGGGSQTTTTYDYTKRWSENLIDSGKFKNPTSHRNPTMAYASCDWMADPVTLGAFTLPRLLIEEIAPFNPLNVDTSKPLPTELQGKAKPYNAGYYVGNDPGSPQVGDLRITFKEVNPTEVSVIAKQVGSTFVPYQTQAGSTIELLQTGILSSDAMIQHAEDGNKIFTWILRAVGFLLMWIGLSMIFKPLSVLADVLPFLGDIVGIGTGLIAFLLAAVMSLVTISIAWIVYRPLLGILLFAIAAGVIVYIGKLMKKKA